MRSGSSSLALLAGRGIVVVVLVVVAVALVAGVRTVSASPIDVEVGGGGLVLDAARRANDSVPVVVVGASLRIEEVTAQPALRMRLAIGGDAATTRMLGVSVRHRWQRDLFVDSGVLAGAVRGTAHLEADAVAIGLEVRAGIDLGTLAIAVHALPLWTFANDGVPLRSAHELGASLIVDL